jgi:hypothetical protein
MPPRDRDEPRQIGMSIVPVVRRAGWVVWCGGRCIESSRTPIVHLSDSTHPTR